MSNIRVATTGPQPLGESSVSLSFSLVKDASVWLALFLFLGFLIGCPSASGPGATGSTVALEGRVVDAADPSAGIPGVALTAYYVYVPFSREAAAGDVAERQLPAGSGISGSDGSFTLEVGAGPILQGAAVALAASPSADSEYEDLSITIQADTNVQVLQQGPTVAFRWGKAMSLLKKLFSQALTGWTIAPAEPPILELGDTVDFSVQAEGAGVPSTLMPTWVVEGGIGEIDANGHFVATSIGSGLVKAYLGKLGVKAVNITVVAEKPAETTAISVSLVAAPTSGNAPLEVTFTGDAQTLDTAHPIVEYVLHFGDATASWKSTSPPTNVTHTYEAKNTYQAVLEAFDDLGRRGVSRVVEIVVGGETVSNQPPSVDAVASTTTPGVGEAIEFRMTASDPDGWITRLEWDFESDGVYDYSSGTTGTTTHAYTTAGTYTATARVTDNSRLTATDTVTIRVGLGRIAFATDRDGNWEIYVMNEDGTAPRRLTNNAALDYHPDWSPDRSKITFSSSDEIFVMNADGSGQTNLTNNPGTDQQPSWSPDGGKIAFHSDRDGNWEIYVMNIDGRSVTRLTNNSAMEKEPAWSPDGTKIAFFSNRDGNAEIYVMNADGTGQTRLTYSTAQDSRPDWSPDGTKIAFQSDDGIYIIKADGTGLTRLPNTSPGESIPVWSPDGNRIAFQFSGEIYVVNAGGTQRTNLTNNPASDYDPDWSPIWGSGYADVIFEGFWR